ncbi:GNAT family N-acetyltransferase [Oceaniovalibus sp. ACAM 378]|uniref:GNAT family N-acetyltransferase n=1 Tax=Oceaniovalibus sp. ACAM 378 TaxID=2599923 RepID=UPI0011D52C18|nr:GNAT family N-acyltransferase [Oceaniovalibus sp. ACAM 378]TYB89741.1 GNAT family N-acetyltransferase [Oceaniovalibus sp. ACAM 378]
MTILARGRLTVRLAATPADLAAVLRLRGLCFRGDSSADDRDGFDQACEHVLIEDAAGAVVCCFRVQELTAGAIGASYAAQFYGLEPLAGFTGRLLELGRFCIHPGAPDPDILRLAWGALTRRVDRGGIGLLFGCSSFPGTDADSYRNVFKTLAAKHQAPAALAPLVRAPEVVSLAAVPSRSGPLAGPLVGTAAGAVAEADFGTVQRGMPPLLRTYLMMGGWVGDHAVIDRDLATLHVFTGLEIAKVPAARARLLRAVAG